MPLRLRKRKGSSNWYLRGTIRGSHVDESTGTDIWEAAEAIRIRAENGILDRSVFGERESVSFVAAALAYLETERSADTKRYVNKLLVPLKGVLVTQVTQEKVDELARTLYPKRSAETVNRQVYTPVGAILHAAGVQLALRRPRQKKGRNRSLSQDQAALLLANAKGHEKALLAVLFYTGCRISEALRLAWDQVDLARRVVTLDLSKTDEDGEAALHPVAFDALANLPGERKGAVFPWYYRKQAYAALAPVCKAAGVRFTPHMARHSFATWLRQQGKDLRLVQEAGRWKDLKSVARYAHVERREVRDAVLDLPVVRVRKARKVGKIRAAKAKK